MRIGSISEDERTAKGARPEKEDVPTGRYAAWAAIGNSLSTQELSACCFPGAVGSSGIQIGQDQGLLRSQALESTTPGPTLAPTFLVSI